MCRRLGAILAILPAVGAQVSGDSAPYFTCDDPSQVDFIVGANTFVKGICCTQESETCGTGLYPSTCASPACARKPRAREQARARKPREDARDHFAGFTPPLSQPPNMRHG